MRYKILGTTEAYDDHGTPLGVGGPRLRTLLATLALRANRTVPVSTLIDEIWTESEAPPADAPAALQALVGRLRRALGKDAIASAPGGYRLAVDPDDVDLHRFERLVREGTAALDRDDPAAAARTLRAALALWRGPALADLPDRTAATRPEAQRAEATRARIAADLLLGRAPDVVPELRELTAAQPYDESLHALLIRALRDAGRGADALAAYEHARRTLAERLGTDPGPELRALHAELLAAGTPSTPSTPRTPRTPRTSSTSSTQRTSNTSSNSSSHGITDTLSTSHNTETPSTTRTPHTSTGTKPPPKPPHPTRTGNLRPRLTSFVGREPELAAIRSEMRRTRLVTLTGPGGSGKTRLAEEAAAGHPEAWLAELAPLDRPEAVPGAVVSALGLRETVLRTSELAAPQEDPVALLVEYCAQRSPLLVLDNCEHVIGAAAELAEALLTHCPGLTVLATSREPLGVPGESVRPVEPLPPDPAHRLFAERATAVRPDFDPERDADAVAEICRRLDGLPLAIELAAARLRLLTPRQIADRLDDRFRLLTSGSRTVLRRQQTLRAVVDWSWDLLDEAERTVLREVSVFAGGWDLEAAEAVCTGAVADLVGALVDKSLVVAAPGPDGTGMRYRMLETIHEYAAERAAEAPELRAAAERRHSAYIRALVETADPLLRSAEQLPWIRRLETELDNIRAALQRAIETRDVELALALAQATGWFWWLRNYRVEGREWMSRIIALAAPEEAPPEDGDTADKDKPFFDHALATLSSVPGSEEDPLYWPWMNVRLVHFFFVMESAPAEIFTDESGRVYAARIRSAFARPVPAAARFPGLIWPFTLFVQGDVDGVLAALDEALATCRRFGGDWEVAVNLMFRTHTAVDSPGNLEGVDEDLAELRTLSRRVGDRWMRAQVCSAAGEAAMARSCHTEARAEYEEALRLAYEVGAYAEMPFLTARLAEIAYREGDRAGAAKTLAEASDASERYGVADARAFVRILGALLALDEGDLVRARALYDDACGELTRGSPPPQFNAAVGGVEARLVAAERGPAWALPILCDALRGAFDARCAEVINAALIDAAALFLSGLGEHARAARLLAVGTHWRSGHARPMPDRTEAERIEAAALAALGRERYEAERAAGSALTDDEALTELADAADRLGSR